MNPLRRLTRNAKLGALLFGFLVVFGSLPLLINAANTLSSNQRALAQQEKENLTQTTDLLRVSALRAIDGVERDLRQVANALEAIDHFAGLDAVPGQDEEWQRAYLAALPERLDFDLRVVDLSRGRASGSSVPEVQEAMDRALSRIRGGEEGTYELAMLGLGQSPAVVVSLGVRDRGELRWVIQGVRRLPLSARGLSAYIVDLRDDGRVLWAADTEAEPVKEALQRSAVVRALIALPPEPDIIPVMEYDTRVGSTSTPMIGQGGRLGATGWALVVQQPRSTAFREAREILRSSLLSVGLMVLLALIFAAIAARFVTRPIVALVETTQAISKGKFGEKVEAPGLGAEMTALADSFNVMSGRIAEQVSALRQAAQLNRELFIGSVRALLAAIEAKEPYTRGHSERVASYSQAIAQELGLSREDCERIWIAGLLHDIGKIGIDDRVLKKGDVLTDAEYEEMKRHPAIGAEIMSSIDQLRDTLPAIRWHHEDWQGSGYPDGLKGEEIPVWARIVAVADTFDAVTTQRVYQNPYTDEEALVIIQRLTGKRFDPEVAAAFERAFRSQRIVSRKVEAEDGPEGGPRSVVETAAIHT